MHNLPAGITDITMLLTFALLQAVPDELVDVHGTHDLHVWVLLPGVCQGVIVLHRQHHPLDAPALRRLQLLLDRSHREERSAEREFTGHCARPAEAARGEAGKKGQQSRRRRLSPCTRIHGIRIALSRLGRASYVYSGIVCIWTPSPHLYMGHSLTDEPVFLHLRSPMISTIFWPGVKGSRRGVTPKTSV